MTISGDVTMSGRLIVKKDDASLSNAPKVTIEGGKFDAEFRLQRWGTGNFRKLLHQRSQRICVGVVHDDAG